MKRCNLSVTKVTPLVTPFLREVTPIAPLSFKIPLFLKKVYKLKVKRVSKNVEVTQVSLISNVGVTKGVTKVTPGLHFLEVD